ncbi:MAG: hypothetical protein ABEJ91_01010 [Candidatus Nanohaloarchaea archaeon]
MAEEDDLEDLVIETGVDTLLNYLAEKQKATVSEISEDLGVSEKRIKEWANALEDSEFLEKSYSARQGMVLEYTRQNKEAAEKKLDELREEVEEKTSEVQEELESRGDEIEDAKKRLEEMTEELEDNRQKEEEVKEKLEKLEELEGELEEKLQQQAQKEEKLHSRSVNLLSKIDSALDSIEQAEEKATEFEEEKDQVRKKIKAMKKLEKHAETAEEFEDQLEDLEEEEEEAKSIFKSFKAAITSLAGGSRYSKALEGTVDEAKEEIVDMESPDYDRLMELEQKGKNRETLLRWLESRKDE